MDIPSLYEINNVVRPPDKTMTYSRYKKTEVLSAFQKAILNKDIQTALSLGVELHISGYIEEIWKKIILIMSKHIYTIEPTLCIYIEKEYCRYKKVISEISESYNNQQIRNQMSEIITLVTVIDKQKPFKLPKITNNDFQTFIIQKNVRASAIHAPFLPNDSKTIHLPINEFAYHFYLNDHSHETKEKCFFWLNWLFFFEKARRKKKKEIICASRPNSKVDPKFYGDYVWILWKIIKLNPILQTNSKMKKMVDSLYNLYCNNYTKGSKIRKRIHLINAIIIVLDTFPRINYNKCENYIYPYYHHIIRSQMNINSIYTSVHENNIRMLEEEKRKKMISDRNKTIRPRKNRKNSIHFQEYLKEKMYIKD